MAEMYVEGFFSFWVQFTYLNVDSKVSMKELFGNNRRVVVVGVVGAFTSTCSDAHVPGAFFNSNIHSFNYLLENLNNHIDSPIL